MRQLLTSILAIGLGLVPAMAQAPARDNTAVAGKAVIRGRVLAAETGRPLGKARVRLVGPEVREGLNVRTDAEGRFEFKELPAGRFQLTASKAGYVQLQYGQLRAFEIGKSIVHQISL